MSATQQVEHQAELRPDDSAEDDRPVYKNQIAYQEHQALGNMTLELARERDERGIRDADTAALYGEAIAHYIGMDWEAPREEPIPGNAFKLAISLAGRSRALPQGSFYEDTANSHIDEKADLQEKADREIRRAFEESALLDEGAAAKVLELGRLANLDGERGADEPLQSPDDVVKVADAALQAMEPDTGVHNLPLAA